MLSEVVKPHRPSEVESCKLGPRVGEVESTSALHKSSSATGFQLSGKLRHKAAEFLPLTLKHGTLEVQPKVVEVFDHLPGKRPRKVIII